MSAFLAKASKASRSARLLSELDYHDGTTDRAFFAMFHAARALLASRGMDAERIRSHSKVRALLKRHFVDTGELAPDLAEAFRRADKMRRVADVGLGDVGPDVAAEMVQLMDGFMSRTVALLAVREEVKR